MFNLIEISKGCGKGLLLALNILCILVALCTFGFTVVDIKLLKLYGEEQSASCSTGYAIIIVASILLIITASVGCVGIGRESVKILYLYVGLVMMMVLLELLTAIFVSVQRYGLQYRVTEWIRENFYRNVTEDNREQHTKLWDELQTTYECCGLNGPDDYEALKRQISLSCCPRAYRAPSVYARKLLYKSCVENAIYYKNGCEEEILYILQDDADWLIGVAVISFWLEAVGIVLAMWVSSHLKNSVQVYKHTVKY